VSWDPAVPTELAPNPSHSTESAGEPVPAENLLPVGDAAAAEEPVPVGGAAAAEEPVPVGDAAAAEEPRSEDETPVAADATESGIVDAAAEQGDVPAPPEVIRIAAAVAGLDNLRELALPEHVARYEAVHAQLSEALASIDEI
jgi:hypothetical protein